MNLFIDITVACLALYGFYSLILTVSERVIASPFCVAVAVKDERDADLLDMLLHEAASAFFQRKGMQIVILFSAHLFENGTVGSPDGELYESFSELVEQYGAECYMIDWNTK